MVINITLNIKKEKAMTTKITRFAGLLLILSVMVTTGVFAQNTAAAAAAPERKTIIDYKDELKLTADQVEKIQSTLYELEKNVKDLYAKTTALDKDTADMLKSNGDLKVISGKIKESFALKADMVVNEISAGRKVDSILTEEQNKKWKEIRVSESKKMRAAVAGKALEKPAEKK